MRWFFGLVLVVALIGGALYGVGRFLLPNDLEVSRSVTIERPRAAVFAMTNDLRIVKEWSPYYARDPDADYVISDTPGEGQSMRWASTVREVGNGRMSIVGSTENEEVETILELGDRATLNTRLEIRPTEAGANVAWSVTAECAEGSINVPCRYMNLILRQMVERDLDSGLTRLKTLTEQLPNVNFEGLNQQEIEVEPEAYVFSTASTSSSDQAEFERAQRLCLDAVQRFMSEYQLTPSGPLVRVTTAFDRTAQRIEFRAGFPFSGPRPLTVANVQIGETPSGPALRVIHEGPRSQVLLTYARIEAYLQAHRIARREDGLPWEVVHSEGDVITGAPARIDIYVPLQ